MSCIPNFWIIFTRFDAFNCKLGIRHSSNVPNLGSLVNICPTGNSDLDLFLAPEAA
jgi:hypothetical protein